MRRLKALYGASKLTQRRHDLETAQEFYQQSLRLAREEEDPAWMALSLSGLGSIVIEDGTLADKQSSLEESAAFARSTGDAWLLSLCLLWLGHCVRLRDNAAALPIFKENLDGNRSQIAVLRSMCCSTSPTRHRYATDENNDKR